MDGALFPRKAGRCSLPKILPFTRLDLAREILSPLNYSSLFPCCSSGQFQALICHDFLSFWGFYPLFPNSRHPGGVPQHSWDFPTQIRVSSPSRWEARQEQLREQGRAGLDPAGAPAFGSTSQPAWPWNAGKASSSARKNAERGNRAGNSREKLGIVLCKECWRQTLAALRAEARPGSAPRGAASLCLPPGSAPGIALLGAVPGLLRSLEMDQSVQRILSPSSRRSVGIWGA